jgi:hypothetical protein
MYNTKDEFWSKIEKHNQLLKDKYQEDYSKEKTPKERWDAFWLNFRARPGMYLGINSVTRLEMFLQGFKTAETLVYQNSDKFVGFNWKEFEQFIADEYNEGSGCISSFSIALRHCSYDEKMAFNRWFQWYDEYERRKIEAELIT